MEKKRLPRLAYNWISTAGALIALVSAFAIVFLLVVNFLRPIINPYLGILLYMVLPFFLVLGLLIIPLGMYLKWRIWQRTGEMPNLKWPSVDLNNTHHRNAALVFILGTLAFFLLSSIGVYQAYHFTDSVVFCGTTCHKVMKPEYTAYQHSPHARVKCVECHIGSGAGWYARSKLTGLYQVYAVLTGVYPRPIPTPIEDLRPARETCEQCHWPNHFFGATQRLFTHYRYDPSNTYWPINMLIKVGGGTPGSLRATGIHWHAGSDILIEYIPRDRQRQDIPWVRVTDRTTGKSTVYQDAANPPSGAVLAVKPRVMDCIDCHNRPSHNYHSPDYAVDIALASGQIRPDLPEIKKAAVAAMAQEYRSDAEAMQGIAQSLAAFYRKGYPALTLQKGQSIDEAVRAVQEAYRKNIFPVMKARWSAYPNNIGHFIFRGCMRCHDGTHKSAGGEVIPNDCRTCHLILSQGNGGPESLDLKDDRGFRHPVDIGDAWKEGACYNCHTGVQP